MEAFILTRGYRYTTNMILRSGAQFGLYCENLNPDGSRSVQLSARWITPPMTRWLKVLQHPTKENHDSESSWQYEYRPSILMICSWKVDPLSHSSLLYRKGRKRFSKKLYKISIECKLETTNNLEQTKIPPFVMASLCPFSFDSLLFSSNILFCKCFSFLQHSAKRIRCCWCSFMSSLYFNKSFSFSSISDDSLFPK